MFSHFPGLPTSEDRQQRALWSEDRGARQASVVPHLFISLFITFAANIFTIVLFCGLFAKCIVSQVCFKCSPGWRWGRAGKQLQRHYRIDLSFNDLFFVIGLHKAGGAMETGKASWAHGEQHEQTPQPYKWNAKGRQATQREATQEEDSCLPATKHRKRHLLKDFGRGKRLVIGAWWLMS